MIGYLKGKLIYNQDGKALVVVGDERTAVGYSVCLPEKATYQNLALDEVTEFFIYTHIREDAFDLYGFRSQVEKEIFTTLLSVNGIGPKAARSILSHCEPTQFVQAILEKNFSALNAIAGIGKKTAERLILELQDSIKKKVSENPDRFALKPTLSSDEKIPISEALHSFKDAKEALVNLGYREAEVVSILNKINLEQKELGVDVLVKRALHQLR